MYGWIGSVDGFLRKEKGVGRSLRKLSVSQKTLCTAIAVLFIVQASPISLFWVVRAADAPAPGLQLRSPANNSYFDQDNHLEIAGVGDADTFYTVLVDSVVEKVTFFYDANGAAGAIIDPNSPNYSYSIVTVMENAFTYEGRTFTGWNTKGDGSGATYKPGDSFAITQDAVLYAQWKKEGEIVTTGDILSTILIVGLLFGAVGILLFEIRKCKRMGESE